MQSYRHLSLLRGQLLKAAGLGALVPLLCTTACGTEVDFNEAGSGPAGPGPATGVTTAATSGTGSNAGGSGPGGAGQGGAANGGAGQGGQGTGGGGNLVETCYPVIDPNSPCPSLSEAPITYGNCTYEGNLVITSWVSGPVPKQGSCCYMVETDGTPCPVIGRPLVGSQGAVTARARIGDRSWSAPKRHARGAPPLGSKAANDEAHPDASLEPRAREALAEAWAHDGLYEHASVASFSRFALELMAVGAPSELVAAAHEAALDETRHAMLCFALASRYRGEPVGAGKLPLDAVLALRTTLSDMAEATAREGCIGETISAAIAREQLERATDPDVREALAIVAEDEARHAELAWQTVAWAIRTGGTEVRDAVARAFREASSALPGFHTAADRALEAHGRLTEDAAREVSQRALMEVVLPCARTLLASVGPGVAPD